MALYVNTNVSSLNGRTNLNKANGSLDTTYARLSSGLRINSAKDDAAGLMISDRLTSQINGLNQGNRNANDGIALAQTAEGAMDEITNMLQRIRTLANQSATGSNTDEDRASIQKEVTSLSEEITRIAEKTTFGGKKILAGADQADTSKGGLLVRGKVAVQVGANANDTISVSLSTGFRLSDMADAMGEQKVSVTKGIDQYRGYSSSDKAFDLYKMSSNGIEVEKATDYATTNASSTLGKMYKAQKLIDNSAVTTSYINLADKYTTAVDCRDSCNDVLSNIKTDDDDAVKQAYDTYKEACQKAGYVANSLTEADDMSAWQGSAASTTDSQEKQLAKSALSALQNVVSNTRYEYTN